MIPGLPDVLQLKGGGILGICLSGAGPTVLALYQGEPVVGDAIGKRIKDAFLNVGVESVVRLLNVCWKGASIVEA